MYYCIELLDSEKKRLKNMFWDNIAKVYLDGWKVYCDHCTLIHSSNKDWETISKYLDLVDGHPIKFNVYGLGMSEHAIAVMTDVHSQNAISHITLAIAPGHKPVESNDIEDWIVFKKKYSFIGLLKKKK